MKTAVLEQTAKDALAAQQDSPWEEALDSHRDLTQARFEDYQPEMARFIRKASPEIVLQLLARLKEQSESIQGLVRAEPWVEMRFDHTFYRFCLFCSEEEKHSTNCPWLKAKITREEI